ncbi:hypothetical protein R7P64_13230 [Vibrio sp. 2304]|uniref:hypothetical protein n=1 Tax=Vibrio sp. 2304 TaxID=3074601 RepID=UPI0029644403|nr:hypothetical protein [Vibrio sp. 2304]MDW2001545.1 hypothetical protein [Vibrio sp. 2304]
MLQLESRLIGKIHEKATKECGVTNLLYVSSFIKQLDSYLSGNIELSVSEIEKKLDFLIGCMTLTLDLPYVELELLRARKCEKEPFSNVSELSYIHKPSVSFPRLGRLNAPGIPLFYAAIIDSKCDKGLHVVLSEANAHKMDQLSILRSHQKSGMDLNLRSIGVWDYIRQNIKPSYMSENVYEYYSLAFKEMSNAFSKELLLAYRLTDRFLAEIMCRNGSDRLYSVTSIASQIMLDSKNIDGIVYSSVASKGEPVIALKPESVDAKLEHKCVSQVAIREHYGYGFYNYENIKIANMNEFTGQLVW